MNRYKLRIPIPREGLVPYHAPVRYLATYVSAYSPEHAIAIVKMPRGYRSRHARDLIEVTEVE